MFVRQITQNRPLIYFKLIRFNFILESRLPFISSYVCLETKPTYILDQLASLLQYKWHSVVKHVSKMPLGTGLGPSLNADTLILLAKKSVFRFLWNVNPQISLVTGNNYHQEINFKLRDKASLRSRLITCRVRLCNSRLWLRIINYKTFVQSTEMKWSIYTTNKTFMCPFCNSLLIIAWRRHATNIYCNGEMDFKSEVINLRRSSSWKKTSKWIYSRDPLFVGMEISFLWNNCVWKYKCRIKILYVSSRALLLEIRSISFKIKRSVY